MRSFSVRLVRALVVVLSLSIGALAAQGGVTAAADAASQNAAELAAVKTSATAKGTVAGALVRSDAVAAKVTARVSGKPVEDTGAEDEYTKVYAEPDGTWKSVSSTEPVQVRTSAGTWAATNLALTVRDGRVVPTRAAWAGSFSAGGDRALLDLTQPSTTGPTKTLSWKWAAKLPKPTLSGDTATYANVEPDTDLVVTALPSGFEDSFVVKAKPSGPISFTTPVDTDGAALATSTNHSLVVGSASHPRHNPWLSAAQAQMHDSSKSLAGPQSAAVATTVAATASGAAVTLTPSLKFLDDPSTVYPVTIDPTYSIHPAGDTWIDNVNNQTSQTSDTSLSVGTYNGGTTTARAFLQFDQGDDTWDGTDVLSAKLNLDNYYSHTCTAGDVHAVEISSSWTFGGLTWSNQPSVNTANYDAFDPGYGHDSTCPEATATFDVTNIVQAWAGGDHDYGIRLKANDETDSNSWRQYRSANYATVADRPQLVVTYNSYPAVPTTPEVSDPQSYAPSGGSSSVYTSSATPTFSGTVKDPDGGTVRDVFHAYLTKDGSYASSCTSPYVASGAIASCALTTSLADGTYWVRSHTYDGTDYSVGGPNTGGWSNWTQITVASGTPSAPAISCPGYANGSWAASNPSANLSCTISATGSGTSAPSSITYSIDGAKYKTVAIPQSSSASTAKASVTVSDNGGGHSIAAYDASPSGLKSSSSTDSFGYGTVGLTAPVVSPLTITSGNAAIAAAGPATSGGTPTVSVQWRLAGSGGNSTTGWTSANADAVNLNVVSNSSGVTVTGLWNAATSVSESGLNVRTPNMLDVQVCIQYSTGPLCSWSNEQPDVEYVPHAFGDGLPTTDVQDGQLALWTGEFETDATDADLPAGSDDLTIDRDASTFAGAPSDPAEGVFGPGWTTSLTGPQDGDADLQIVDNTRHDGTVDAYDDQGDLMVFAPASGASQRTTTTIKAGSWVPQDKPSREAGITATVSGTGSSTKFALVEPDGTTTTWQVTKAPSTNQDSVFTPVSVQEPGEPGATGYVYNANALVTRITAPIPAGVTCPTSGSIPAGCRALIISYASATTATSSTPGDYLNQVKTISTLVGNASGGTTTVVATYKYDTSGRMVSETNALDSLTTAYTYDGSSNRIASITDPGMTTTNYSYDSSQQLQTVTRARPSGDPTGGTATLDTIVYNVPTHGTGMPDLSATNVATWNQTDIPTYAAAVFGPDDPVNPSSVSSSDWPYAELYYTDANGYQTNTAEYGAGQWLYTDTEYDSLGNPVRELSEADIANIQAGLTSAQDAGTLTVYNSEQTDGSGNVILPADSEVSDTYAPARYAIIADGSTAWVRPHTHTDYDQGAPNSDINPNTGDEYALPTTTTVSAADPSSLSDLQTMSVTDTGYANAVPGGDANAGWNLGLASSSTVDMGSEGSNITSTTTYIADGQVASTGQPLSNGSDAGTREDIYYTAGTNSAATSCGNQPANADLLCETTYAGAPSAGPALITTVDSGYNSLQEPTTVTETSGSATRTTTYTYRADGDQTGKTVSVTGVSGSTSVPSLTYGYDSSTGLQTSINPSSGSTITTGYDSWGRQTSYSPAAGERTTTSYNADNQVASVTDPQGTTSYTYDGTDAAGNTEHRGLVTEVDVSNAAGTTPVKFTGAYNANGDLIDETMPGAITLTQGYDIAGDLATQTYSGDVTSTDDSGNTTTTPDSPWIGWSQDHDAADRIIDQWTPDGAALTGDLTGAQATGYSRNYTYDRDDRLTQVIDQEAATAGLIPDPGDGAGEGDQAVDGYAATNCFVRNYTFDADGNRTALATTPANADGSCQTGSSPTGVTTKTWSYDSADRLTGGYTYDALGRQTTIPQADTPEAQAGGTPGDLNLSYYDTDAIQSLTQNGTTTTHGIDAAGRRTTQATGPTDGSATATTTDHYTDDSDDPGWASTVTNSGTTINRYADDLTDGLAGIINGSGTVRDVLTDPNGNTVSTVTLSGTTDATGLDNWNSTDEYGNPEATSATAGTTATNPNGASDGNGYAWHGAADRAVDTTGLTLMGARLYNPVTGNFTSTDPIYGGNTTAYTYPQDPINSSDLAGTTQYDGGPGADEGYSVLELDEAARSSERSRSDEEHERERERARAYGGENAQDDEHSVDEERREADRARR